MDQRAAVDREAHLRGETLYGADSKVPLHPRSISEDAGSLLPEQVRPALLWTIKVDDLGEGTDVTVVAISSCVPESVAAAEALAAEGVSVEVIDPRTLVPLDTDAILESVSRTGRLVIADPAHRTCGAAAEISAIVSEEIFDSLRAPIVRVTTPDMQIPFSPALEKQMYPNRNSIAEAIRKVAGLA